MRGTLRQLVDLVPDLINWLLTHTFQSTQKLVLSIRSKSSSSVSSTKAGHGWAVAEVLLHSVTAITKNVMLAATSTAFAVPSRESTETEFVLVLQLLQILNEAEAASCRPVARMGVILIGELLPKAIQFHLTHSSTLRNVPPGSWESYFSASMKTIVYSILVHCEEPFESSTGRPQEVLLKCGSRLPFRIKQDHIGAVSMLKVMEGMGGVLFRNMNSHDPRDIHNQFWTINFSQSYDIVASAIEKAGFVLSQIRTDSSKEDVLGIIHENYARRYFGRESEHWISPLFGYYLVYLGTIQSSKQLCVNSVTFEDNSLTLSYCFHLCVCQATRLHQQEKLQFGVSLHWTLLRIFELALRMESEKTRSFARGLLHRFSLCGAQSSPTSH